MRTSSACPRKWHKMKEIITASKKHTLSTRLLCRLTKCWSINFSARKDFLQKPQCHSLTSKWILCCSCSRNMSFSGWSLHLLGSSYFSLSTKGIKYCIKGESWTSNVTMHAQMQCAVTLHVLPHQQLSKLHGSFPLSNAPHVCMTLFDEELCHQVKTQNSSVLCPKTTWFYLRFNE